jgi:hypothetical protein
MRHIRPLLFASFAAIAMAGCSAFDIFQSCPSGQICVNGTAEFYNFEGGFWAIQGDDDVTYDPVGALPLDFRQPGLRVYLRAKERPDMASFHMAGPIVEILEIRRID